MATKTSSKERTAHPATSTVSALAVPKPRPVIDSGDAPLAECGDGMVKELASELARRCPGARGSTRLLLVRMRQYDMDLGDGR